MAQQPIVGQGLLIIEASRSHSDTPHSVGLLCTSPKQKPLPDTPQHSQECAQWDSNLQSQQQTHALDRSVTGNGRVICRALTTLQLLNSKIARVLQNVKDGGPHSPNLFDLSSKGSGPARRPTQASIARYAECSAHPLLILRKTAAINLLVPYTSS